MEEGSKQGLRLYGLKPDRINEALAGLFVRISKIIKSI